MTDAEHTILQAVDEGPKSFKELMPLVARNDQATLTTVNVAVQSLIDAGKIERKIINRRPIYVKVEA